MNREELATDLRDLIGPQWIDEIMELVDCYAATIASLSEPELMTAAEMADYLGLSSPDHARVTAHRKKLTSVNLPGRRGSVGYLAAQVRAIKKETERREEDKVTAPSRPSLPEGVVRWTLPLAEIVAYFIGRHDTKSAESFGFEASRATGLSSGTTYPILRRLQNAGWLLAREEDEEEQDAGRPPRIYYRINPEHLETIRQQLTDRSARLHTKEEKER